MHLIIILGTCLTMAYAMPSYIAVPADQIAFVDLTALRSSSRSRIRVPRQILTPPPQLPEAIYEENYQPIPIHNYHQGTVALAPPPPPEDPRRIQSQPEEDGTPSSSNIGAVSHFAERPPDFGEYVDFGAHTGDNGAFGWYADYPVNNQDSSGYRK